MSAAFALIQRFLRETSGWALESDRRYLVEDRLQPVLQQARMSSLDQLAAALGSFGNADLGRRVTEALTINETSFFRDRSLFAEFADRILPRLMLGKMDPVLRIWSVGCSTGQEPYSIAMLLDGHANNLAGWRVEIVATDLSQVVIDRARRGSYSQFEVQRGLPVTMLLRHFRRDGDIWQINDDTKAKIAFGQRNLLSNFESLGVFDVIFCRNVLIYFDRAVKQQVLGKLAGALSEGGYLALGATERTGDAAGVWRSDGNLAYVYRKEKAQRAHVAPDVIVPRIRIPAA